MPRIITDRFEQQMNQVFDSNTIAVNNGTSALIAALWYLDLQPGDEIITTPFTFVATANAIVIAGGTPVFVDINRHDRLINPQAIANATTIRTRAIIPVHLFGRVCDMDAIKAISEYHGGIPIIEDAAQAFLARDALGRLAGTMGDVGCFSFYKTKNMSTFEGGALVIPKESRWDSTRLRKITDQGKSGHFEFSEIGFNFRMPEPCALIGYEKLKLHRKQIEGELGAYDERNGYYPYLVYQYESMKKRGITGNCPVAEEVVNDVRTKSFNSWVWPNWQDSCKNAGFTASVMGSV